MVSNDNILSGETLSWLMFCLSLPLRLEEKTGEVRSLNGAGVLSVASAMVALIATPIITSVV